MNVKSEKEVFKCNKRGMAGMAVLSISALVVILGTDVGLLRSSAHSIEDFEDMNNADVQIVFPERLHHRARRDTPAGNTNNNDDKERIRVNAFGRSLVLDVTRNDLMVPEDFLVRSFNEEGKQTIQKSAGILSSCHYQGHIEGHPESSAMLDICDGISGIIEDERETFSIMPFKAKGFNAHKMKRTSGTRTIKRDLSCGTVSRNPTDADKEKRFGTRSRRSLAIDPLFRSYIPVKKTRYAELIIIVDQAIYNQSGSNTSEAQRRIFDLVNAVDMIYQQINIRIIIKALEIWTQKDLVPFDEDAAKDLNNLQKYRENHADKYKCDILQLLRGKEWKVHGGMAYMGEMCTVRSTGVVGWNKWSVIGPWIALAHEMGHNFGFDHDDHTKCKCLTPRGCIMRTFKTRVAGFSDCNLRDLQKINDKCLYNVPVKSVNSQCGNGIKEGNEECDCGTKENCAIMDTCCNPKTCRLYPSSQCSNQHDKCCKNCQYAPTGSICRKADGWCDVPEFCTGKSGQCPPDDYHPDGTACHVNDLELAANNNDYQIKMTRLPSRIRARFVRISPQHWNKDICMRTEIYGCNRVPKSNTPTLLRSDNNLFVDADTGICDANDVSELVFKPLDQGTKRNMEFKIMKDGTLIHHCTGNMVCPKDAFATYGTKLVVSKRCTKQSAKFRRRGKSLEHVESGFCVHPYQGLAQDGTSLVLWKGCKSASNIALTFVKPDCEAALGMESGGIPNNRIKATTFRTNREALHARLNGFNSWCAGKTNKRQYLQIDLGKVKVISAIATEGRNDDTRVTGYKLYYSTNGQRWTAYSGRRTSPLKNSYCFRGKCAATRNSQCRDLWSPTSFSAPKACYNKLNTQNAGYGTCHPARIQPCLLQDALCGQLQCSDKTNKNPTVSYGVFAGKKNQCSLVARNRTRGDTLGMVKNGTKCGENKICVNYKCHAISSLVTQSCPRINGKKCAGNGLCTARGKCHCKGGYDPLTNCSTVTFVVNGEWSSWSSWSTCSRICDGGKQTRHRFCDNPVPSLTGRKCPGKRIQNKRCNLQTCPVVHSCRHLQAIGRQRGIHYPSGVYTINPGGQGTVKTFCDMTRNGGGWTLLVTSHTNTWTSSNVRRRAENNPALDEDFSILFAANSIKDGIRVIGSSFEYRIEAQQFGRWGGIWKAPRSYSFTATNNKQTKIKLIQKFDQWVYEDLGIEKRIPWIHGAMLTTSADATNPVYAYGSITSNITKFYPAPWIFAEDSEKHPLNIWYWMREGPIREPTSCMELQLLGIQSKPLNSGIYTLKSRGENFKTYCDFTADGGGWTLLVTSTSRTGWTRKTVRKRNVKRPSLSKDFSILGFSDDIIRQRHFQYKIEDDTSRWGGIFEAGQGQRFLSGSSNQTRIKLLKKYGSWHEKQNLGQRLPYIKDSTLLLTTASTSGDDSGTIVSSTSDAVYLPNKMERPTGLRLWVREGAWRSCNQIKQNIKRHGQQSTLDDGLYMIQTASYQYLPVMCDMTSDQGAWTLLVTSASNGWLKSQVKKRNTDRPSLSRDYSVLELGDQIKDLSGGDSFMYKLEANEHGHWGGVWKVPKSYSFVATNNGQTNVTLVKKYDDWRYNWANSLEKRMPWLGERKGLLTTSSHADYSEWGTIVSDLARNDPAPWIDADMVNPGYIWYWVNEDDCGPNRTPVDGGLSSWSAWSSCSPLCNAATGVQSRTRSCSNPAPRCGGRSCNPADLIPEKRRCSYCPKSPIKGPRNLCIQPSTANCNPPENTRLVYTRNSNNCDQDYMDFLYNEDTGTLKHYCSGKYVCPQGQADYGTPLVLSNFCSQSHARFQITRVKGLRHKQSGKCVHPNLGAAAKGIHLVTWSGCKHPKLKLDLFKLRDSDYLRTIPPSKTTTTPTTSPSTPTATPTRKVARSRDSPVRSHGGFCWQPSTADCSPPEGTEITYGGAGGRNVQCSQKYMLFTLTKSGRLKHTCSGKYLCPDPDYLSIDGSVFNGVPVVLRNKCSDSRTKYTRTSRKSLRHRPSGFCIHPESGTPTSGTRAVFWNRCGLNRLTLDFYKLRD